MLHTPLRAPRACLPVLAALLLAACASAPRAPAVPDNPVSYTHLTLPTNREV